MGFSYRISVIVLAIVVLNLAITSLLPAGMSPENIVVVVNGKSNASRTVANHFVEARSIPHNNVIVLQAVPDGLKVSLEHFKTRILSPILQQIDQRGLFTHARVIAYSADFPVSVDIRDHHARLKDPQLIKYQRPTASITGLTYFYQAVMADNEIYLNFGSNLYARTSVSGYFVNPFAGENGAKFDRAVADLEKQPAQSAKAFAQLVDEFPTLAPMALRAAEAYAKAGDDDSARKMVKHALHAEWWSRDYLVRNKLLAPLLDDPEIAQALSLLPDVFESLQSPVAFSSQKSWTRCGYPIGMDQGGMRYLMACSLAVLHKRGSRLDQSIKVLQRASAADWTFPQAEFRFADHVDVRAKTRSSGIAAAVNRIKQLGFETEVFDKSMSRRPGMVAGLMMGSPTIDFANRPWKFVPGAMSENLTSLGAAFGRASQTKLTEFLHAGAAISSGTVTEPYSLQPKFPRPMMYAYYAAGATAIESYYLSVSSPYQLLIVGDPACQPFAKPPRRDIDFSVVEGEQKSIRMQLSTAAIPYQADQMSPIRAMELHVGKQAMRVAQPVPVIDVNVPESLSGVIDMRVVLIGQDSNEPRKSYAKSLDLSGTRPTPVAVITASRSDQKDNFLGLASDGAKSGPITISLKCPGADAIDLMHHGEVVATFAGDVGSIKVATHRLGGGPLRIRPVARFGDEKVVGFDVVDRW